MPIWPAFPKVPLPGPPTSLFGRHGNLFRLFKDPIELLPALRRQYGDVVALAKDNPGIVCAFGPSHNQKVLADARFFYNLDNETLGVFPGNALHLLFSGVVSMNGANHTRHRRIINPAFLKKALANYQAAIAQVVLEEAERLPQGAPLDMLEAFERMTTEVALRTLFGLDGSSEENDALRGLLREWFELFGNPLATFLKFDLPGMPYRKLLSASERLVAVFRQLIARKRKDTRPGTDVLAMLLAARDEDGSALTDDEVIGHAYVLFIAGHHTTTSGLTWTLFLLERHPEVLDRVVEETSAVCGGGAPSFEQLDRLTELDHAISESLRLFPPGTFQIRVGTGPFELGGKALPAGAKIVYSSYVTHRMPELFEDPLRFVPGRWETISPSPWEYLPFGAGPRKCIGAGFALVEMKIVLSVLLQRFRPALVPGTRLDRRPVPALRPAQGLPVTLHPRDHRPPRTPVSGNVNEMMALPSA